MICDRTKIVGKYAMPGLLKGQEYMCSNGCGSCSVVEDEFECSRTDTKFGDLISREVEIVPVSSCCRADLDIWDNNKDDIVQYDFIDKSE